MQAISRLALYVCPNHTREGKNQEDLIGSEMDLLCETDASGLLADLLCTLRTSCDPAASIIVPLSDPLWL